LEILLGLPGETHDQVRRQHDVRHSLPQPVHQCQVPFVRIAAVHLCQNAVGAGLRRQVQVMADLGQFGKAADQFVRQILRVGSHHADAADALHFVHAAQELRERAGRIQALAVGVDVLPQKRDFPAAVFRQEPHFPEDVLRLSAALPATDMGHDAISAEVITAVRDGYPALKTGSTVHRQVLGHFLAFIFHTDDARSRRQGLQQ